MQISQTMNEALNQQVTAEFGAAHKYLAMACVFDGMGLKMLRERFFKQYHEECEHALKIVRYLLEVDATVKLVGIAQPKSDYKTVEEMVRAALQSEQNVTQMINDLVALADSEKDYATRSFLNWFVDEQVEEVSNMSDLLRLVQLARDNMLQVEARVQSEMGAKD